MSSDEYVLTLVLQVEKAERPGQTDALETAARAVLAILADDRSAGEGEWAEVMRRWQDARIRKVVRRARGAEWRRAAELPGITVVGAAAVMRVFPPVPLDEVPKDLAKLQVTGTDLEDPEELPAVADGVPVLWVNPGLTMSTGKTMAQVGHGVHLAWFELSDAERKAWREEGFRLAVRTATPLLWKELMATGLPVVQDAGFTEIDPGSYTVIADHPALR
ncbi:aminoacyl-tRNA hydrolase [Kribbella sp. CA-293567]|uniref:aminoacyl-tRNA hydrolase n=1 Tax=Kribbella sp. CA-293567 TaxID=3002436 RepID=UPI0022DD8871|nr:aminoacyl-tRNA hydrolase [Kribbella sp. CA-293567]WBQ06542.1 aminoacyl-tRNA hydrolase [Kribbella sp. CA-293567]